MVEIETAAAVVLAAGNSTRMGGAGNKVLQPLGDRPVLAYSLAAFEACAVVTHAVVVGRETDRLEIEALIRKYCPKAIGCFTLGGVERFDSVRNGLEFLSTIDPDAVIIHDSARPFLRQSYITKSLDALKVAPGCVIGVPLKDTLKEVSQESGEVILTHDRSRYWLAQTPQTFRYRIILEAYRALCPPPYPTDDGAVLELAGQSVKMVEGSYQNIKVTTPEDWVLARSIPMGDLEG